MHKLKVIPKSNKNYFKLEKIWKGSFLFPLIRFTHVQNCSKDLNNGIINIISGLLKFYFIKLISRKQRSFIFRRISRIRSWLEALLLWEESADTLFPLSSAKYNYLHITHKTNRSQLWKTDREQTSREPKTWGVSWRGVPWAYFCHIHPSFGGEKADSLQQEHTKRL